MEIKINGSEDSFQLDEQVFGVKVNSGLVHQVLTAFMAGSRQGSKAQKSRADVRGGGKAPWRQKGTGRARAGSSRSPIWRHGGVTFAARPRNYEQKLNKKMYKAGMRSILSALCADGRLQVVDSFSIDKFSTKQALQKLQDLNVSQALLVVSELDEFTYYSTRNLPNVELVEVGEVNPWLLLRYPSVVCSKDAIAGLSERFAK